MQDLPLPEAEFSLKLKSAFDPPSREGLEGDQNRNHTPALAVLDKRGDILAETNGGCGWYVLENAWGQFRFVNYIVSAQILPPTETTISTEYITRIGGNMKLNVVAAVVALGVCLSGCATVSVKPVDISENQISEVCIKLNPKVIVPEFTDILEEGFLRHGIKTKIYAEIPPQCNYSLTYVAFQKWDFVLYLSSARLDLYKGDRLIGYANRDGGNGLAFSKFDSTRTKINPMIDQLLAGYK